jgi:cytochrome c oxidase subunit 2
MRRGALPAWAALAAIPAAARADAPESYLATSGPAADPITALMWWLLIVSVAVSVIMGVLVLWGVLARGRSFDTAMANVALQPRGSGVRWIWIGVAISSALLLASTIWTVVALDAVAYPAKRPPLTIEVTARQWWWAARYLSDDPTRTFVTANEIHVPVGQPVRLRLLAGDVIHSFWVPALAGKTDMIPGRTNLMWLQADKPGRYRGECQEYCGLQHANMAFALVADPPARFEQWRQAQLRDAPPPATPEEAEGQRLFVFKCGACHTVRGTEAGGTTGPDLTHLMSRQAIAAGAAPNTAGALSGWIANPQGLKPGAHMPTLYLSGPELAQVRSYLLTLQ